MHSLEVFIKNIFMLKMVIFKVNKTDTNYMCFYDNKNIHDHRKKVEVEI